MLGAAAVALQATQVFGGAIAAMVRESVAGIAAIELPEAPVAGRGAAAC